MVTLPGNLDPREVEKTLNKMFSPDWLREAAKRVKYVQRERKVDPVILFWILVLGFGVGVQRTIASLRRDYETASVESIVASAFYDRFTEGLVKFLKECLAHGIADLTSCVSLTLSEKLQGFKDLVVNDGGHFVSRLKSGANPKIVSVLRSYRGNAIDLTGKKLKDVLPRLKWEVIDYLVEVEFKASASRTKKPEGDTFEVYRPRNGASKIRETFRLVGTFDEEAQEYHLYITDIMPEQLSAEDTALLYRARWSVELVFKELKRLYHWT
ncbi:MAG TPA: hypothetical protein DCW46_02265 [Desulfotomaculum sp.]|nr:hypothetical protein [Desulfotomaculum sp.]